MNTYGFKHTKHCRWCTTAYRATKPPGRDGFCSKACKQALYRARKNYVTAKTSKAPTSPGPAVTRKKRKK